MKLVTFLLVPVTYLMAANSSPETPKKPVVKRVPKQPAAQTAKPGRRSKKLQATKTRTKRDTSRVKPATGVPVDTVQLLRGRLRR